MSNIEDFVIQNGTLVKYKGQGGDVVIPDSVTEIGPWAFSGCENLESVIFPKIAMTIGSWAFLDCKNLKGVTIPEGVTEIKRETFSGCESLTGITIPDSVTAIGAYAFSDCSSLKSITIPGSVSAIGEYAFRGCGKLTDFQINENNSMFSSENGMLIQNKTNLVSFPSASGTIMLPEGIESIEANAFENCNLVSIKFPKSLRSIGPYSFFNCRKLHSIDFGEGIQNIGAGAFLDCRKLESVEFPHTLRDIGAAAFRDCRKLVDVSFTEGLQSIGEEAFRDCRKMANINLPESLREIGKSCFWNCSELDSFVLPKDLQHVGRNAFYGCKALKELCLTGTELHIDLKDVFKKSGFIPLYAPEIRLSSFEGTKAKNYALMGYLNHLAKGEQNNQAIREEYIKYMKSHKDAREILYEKILDEEIAAFAMREKLIPLEDIDVIIEKIPKEENVSLIAMLMDYKNGQFTEKEIKQFEDKQFEFREPTPTAVLKKEWTTKKKDDGTLEIRGYKGEELDLIVPTAIGKFCVTSIGEYAFSWLALKCSNPEIRKNIRTIQIPEGVTTIGEEAFSGCSSLTSISIPNSVTTIGNSAFEDCSSLTSIIIPNSVTTIGNSAFKDCNSLTSITSPDGVKTIGNEAFKYCSSLTIQAPSGSCAQKYALEHNIKFEEI